MKIVDVCEFYSPTGGGVRRYINQKLALADRFGHELTVIAPGAETRTEKAHGGTIAWIKSPHLPFDRNYRMFWNHQQVWRTLDRLAPDLLEGSSPWRGLSITLSFVLFLLAINVYVDRFDRLLEHHTIFEGVTYTDAHVMLTGLLIVCAALVLGAGIAAFNAVREPRGRFLVIAIIPAAVCYVGLGVVGWYVGNFVAHGVNDFDFDFMSTSTQQRGDVIRLPECELRATTADA